MNIVQNRKIWFSISGIILIIGLVSVFTKGFNLGIDFTGGTLMEIELHKHIPANEVRETIDKYDKSSNISMLGSDRTTVQIRMNENFDNEERMEIFEDFKTKYNLAEEDLLRANQFGPSVGKEIRNKAFLAIILSAAGMLIYIAFRFELSFAVTAIAALFHDILVVLTLYSVFQIPINSSFVAAILTVLGYSINDTIVIFDRIRENLRFARKIDYVKIADSSIAESLSRSINTSLTTLVAVLALYILGVEQIKEFALPLIVGVVAGTYSSIFIASPLWVIVKQKRKTA